MTCGHSDTALVIRDSIKVTKNFIDWLRYDVITRDFPIKKYSTLTTLAIMLWAKKYQKANTTDKQIMLDEMKGIQKIAEEEGLLKNSRPIGENEEEDD